MTTATLPRRLWSLAIGFPGFHALNMVLGILFTLVQMLIFSRVLPRELFTQTVAATAVSIYALPLNLAVARANFVLMRERVVRSSDGAAMPEAAAAFYSNQAISLIVSLATPPLLGATDAYTYTCLACYLFLCTYTNIWVAEMQMTMLAVERAMRFEYINTGRRLLIFATLAVLWYDKDFLLFTVLGAAQTLAFHVWGLFYLAGDSKLFAWPRGLTGRAMRTHLGLFWVSLQATVAEWVVYNAPYAVFTLRFGIGPELVAIDAVLKLGRVVVSISRNLSEIALPRVSHAILTGNSARARLAVSMVLLTSCGGAAVLAAIVLFDEHGAFGFLLGPNNTVPAGAGAPAALAILASAAFATAGHLIGHTGNKKSIQQFMIAPIVATALFFAVMLVFRTEVLSSLWAFSLAITAVSVTSLLGLMRLLANRRSASSPQSAV